MNYQYLGKQIRKIRTEHNLTQRDFARHLACSPKHLGNIERGVSRPSLECLLDISQALKVSVEYLLYENLSSQQLSNQSELLLMMDNFLEHEQNNIQQFRRSLQQIYQNTLENKNVSNF